MWTLLFHVCYVIHATSALLSTVQITPVSATADECLTRDQVSELSDALEVTSDLNVASHPAIFKSIDKLIYWLNGLQFCTGYQSFYRSCWCFSRPCRHSGSRFPSWYHGSEGFHWRNRQQAPDSYRRSHCKHTQFGWWDGWMLIWSTLNVAHIVRLIVGYNRK